MKSLANIVGCVDDIMATCGDHPELLVQYLCRIQWRYNCIPPEAIELLAVRLGLPVAHIRGVIGFYAFLHETPRGDFDILISDSITDQMLGSRALLDSLCRQLGSASRCCTRPMAVSQSTPPPVPVCATRARRCWSTVSR